MKYYIRYHTGVGDEKVTGTITEAKEIADDGAAYTQQDISIEDENGNEIARRFWYGVKYNEDENDEQNPICFGDFGFYADWT